MPHVSAFGAEHVLKENDREEAGVSCSRGMFSGSCPAGLVRPVSFGSSSFLFWNKIQFDSNSALLEPEIIRHKDKKRCLFSKKNFLFQSVSSATAAA